MIITRRFVFIHFPKTAGTWTAQAIKQVHAELFRQKTPLGELLSGISKWLPFMAPQVKRIIDRMVAFNYGNYDLNELSLKNYHDPLGRRLFKWLIFIGEAIFLFDKHYETLLILRRHTRYAQAPQDFQDLPLVSSMRDPFSWHISRYLYYQNWQTQNGVDESQEFIKIWGKISSFDEYCSDKMMQMQNAYYQGYKNYLENNGGKEKTQYHDELISFYKENQCPPVNHYGLMSIRFIQMYFKQPWPILNLGPKEFDEYWSNGNYKQDLPNITFLEQKNICQELSDYMLKLKYPQEVIHSSQSIPPQNTSSEHRSKLDKNTSQSADKLLKEYYSSKEIVEMIYKLEKPIFKVFPQYTKVYHELLAAS